MKPVSHKSKSIYLFFLLLLYCSNYEDKAANKSGLLDGIDDLFNAKDSCILQYPFNTFPKRINDITISDNYIYVIGESPDHPLVKFTSHGKYLKTISRIGEGPGEIRGRDFYKIAARDSILVIGDCEFNRILVFKNDQYFNEKSFIDDLSDPLAICITDVEIANNGDFLLSCYGNASHHIVVLDQNLTEKCRYYPLPTSAKLIRIMGWLYYYGIQRYNEGFISNFSYPPNIIKFHYDNEWQLISEYSKLNFRKFQILDTTLTIEKIKANPKYDLRLVYKSFSKLHWITQIKEYTIGVYLYYTDQKEKIDGRYYKKAGYQLFVMKEGKILEERSLSSKQFLEIIPSNTHILKYNFFKQDNNLMVRLYFLEFNKQNSLFTYKSHSDD